MAKLKEGDRVRVVTRDLTAQDRKVNNFFPHMHGLTGVIANYYSESEIAIEVDLDTLPKVPLGVHTEATKRMRDRFIKETGEEARKSLAKEEVEFTPHYVLLLQASDLEKI
jgi:hypothetical protein